MDLVQQGSLPFPGPRGFEGLKALIRLKTHNIETLENLKKTYGDHFRIPYFNRLFITHPRHVEHILRSNHRNYVKGNIYEEIMPLLGHGLVTSDGELWRKQRRSIGKEFHSKAIEKYSKSFTHFTLKHLESWQDGQTYDMANEMMEITFKIACHVFFGIEIVEEAQVVKDSFNYACTFASVRARTPFKLPRWVPLRSHLKEKSSIAGLDRVVEKLIVNYKQNPGAHDNILAKIILMQRDNDSMSDKQIRDEIITLLFAGHDTTSHALMWTLYLLSTYPDTQEKINQELTEVLKGKPISYTDLDTLKYLKMVFYESMRLFPPVPHISRKAIEDDDLGDLQVQAGQNIILSPMLTHGDESFFHRASEFIPERFENEDENSINKDGIRYFPFAAGPRKCLGDQFALVEGPMILANLIQNYQFELRKGFVPHINPSIILDSYNGMPLKATRRH